MNRVSPLVIAALATIAITGAEAQTCEGRPGRGAGNVVLGAGFTSGDDASQFSVGISGLGTSAYGGASIGSISYDNVSGSTTTVGGDLGYQLAAGTTGRAQLCPWFGVEFGFGPNDIEGTGADLSIRSFSAGLSWGFRAVESADFAMIRSLSAGVASASVKLSDGVDELTESDTFGQIGLGIGFVFAKQFSIKPSITIPVGLEGADARLGVSASLAVGTKR